MSRPQPRVVLLSLDAFNPDILSEETTPALWKLLQQGGASRAGGWCDLPAVTYVSHATLLSGVGPTKHRVLTNALGTAGFAERPTWAGFPAVRVPTMFDMLENAGIPTAAVFGDQKILDVVRGFDARTHWPITSDLPSDVPTDAFGYVTNAHTAARIMEAIADERTRFVFGHLNETDTIGHLYGPDSPEYLEMCVTTDRLIGDLLQALAEHMRETVVIVLSDHGMELLTGEAPINLLEHEQLAQVVEGSIDDGGAALIKMRDGLRAAELESVLRDIPGVAGSVPVEPGVHVAFAASGQVFYRGEIDHASKHIVGIHGGPKTQRTLAVVGGGHPAAGAIGRVISQTPPHLRDWAPTVASLLGVPVPEMDGTDLSLPR